MDIYVEAPGGKRLVTSLEVLSLSNKTPGEHGRELFLRKQKELLASKVNLVEIDLLRAVNMQRRFPWSRRWPSVGLSTITSRSILSTTSKRFSSTRCTFKSRWPRLKFPSYPVIGRSCSIFKLFSTAAMMPDPTLARLITSHRGSYPAECQSSGLG